MTTLAPPLRGTEVAAPAITVIDSDDPGEVETTLRLLHDGYVEAGFMHAQPSGRRLIRPYLNPGCTFALARHGTTPVGCAAFVPDGPFGLPSDRAFIEEIDRFRDAGEPVVEGGSLVIDGLWRTHTRPVFLHLLATIVRNVLAAPADTRAVFSVAPEMERFTSMLFGAQRAADVRPLYGAPALFQTVTRRELHAHLARPRTASQREFARLVDDPSPDWLTSQRTGRLLTIGRLAELALEQGTLDSLADQIRLLAHRHPGVLEQVLAGPGAAAA